MKEQSTNKHTAEPWVVSGIGGGFDLIEAELQHRHIPVNDSQAMARTFGPDREANARRIVKCVNAMAGIGDDNALFYPGNTVRSVIVSMKTKQLELEQQRDQLLAALKTVQAVANESAGIAGWHLNGDIAKWGEVLPEIDTAIAAVEGGEA
jgi:hypothetical protein